MAKTDIPMTLADHQLSNAMYCLITSRVENADREALWFSVLTKAYHQVQSDNPYIQGLKAAALDLITAHDRNNSNMRIRARLNAAQALNYFAEWRLGLALDRDNVVSFRQATA